MDKGLQMIKQKCQKWFVKFHAGNILLNHDQKSCTISTQRKTLRKNNHHYTAQSIVKVSKLSVECHLHKFCYVSHF